VTLTLAAIVGALIGLVAHDLAAQSLKDTALRPLTGTCPRCGNPRGWFQVRCPECDRRPGREFLVAAAVALVSVGLVHAIGVSWLLVPFGGFLLLTAALVLTDIDEMRIVDRLNLRGSALLVLALGVAALVVGDLPAYWRSLGGGAAYFAGALLLFVLARGNGFGAGDVKLAPLLGAFTTYFSWTILARSVIATAFIGGILAVAVLVFSEAKRDTELPYGPAMILGAWLAVVSVGISAF
jgi:leader peptidase (prepilin peptidase) / N-methyltransferase